MAQQVFCCRCKKSYPELNNEYCPNCGPRTMNLDKETLKWVADKVGNLIDECKDDMDSDSKELAYRRLLDMLKDELMK